MSNFKKLYLPLMISVAMNSCNVYASAEEGNDPRDDVDTRKASSASSSSFSSGSDAAFQERLNGLLKVSTSKTLPHLMDQLEVAKIEQERYMGLIALASPQRLPFMLKLIKTYVALEQERLIGLIKVQDQRLALMLNELNKSVNEVLDDSPETTELSEATADPKNILIERQLASWLVKQITKYTLLSVNSTVLTANFTDPYKAHLMLRVNLEYLNSFGLTRRWNKED